MTATDRDPIIRILLIDDEPSVAHALKLLLEAIGYGVKDFHLPKEALAFIETDQGKNIDLILCDLRMPELNGLDLLNYVCKICPQIPFVLMSAHADTADINKAQQSGAACFLAKPFTPDQVHEIVAKVCKSEP